MDPTPASHPDPAAARGTGFLRRGLKALALGAALSLLFTPLFRQSFVTTAIYTLCISMACWFFIDGGRLLSARWLTRRRGADGSEPSRWPGWPVMLLVLVGGTVLGYTVGNAAGNLITGLDEPGVIASHPRQALTLLVLALLPGAAMTFAGYSRERLASTQALAEVAQRQAAESRLRLLEAQLEPHMLFNTLANLRVLIALDPPRAQAMLDRLIAYLRGTLGAARATRQPLRAEFDRVADYLALMQVRMGERLQTRFDLPAELADLPVPPLLLQPLVENGIQHGLEPQVAGGRIEVGAARQGPDLVLRVRDTGAGLAAASAAPTASQGGTGFGLVQVRERLATLYGSRASLVLHPADDAEGGTLALIRLPCPDPGAAA